jgi:hypothetical protein
MRGEKVRVKVKQSESVRARSLLVSIVFPRLGGENGKDHEKKNDRLKG